MNTIIIEDESRAANKLEKLLLALNPTINILAKIETVEESIAFLKTQPNLDIIFSDIQLADGICFEIFDKVAVKCPIIFTTAFDNYAIKAFKTNGIDYLLKPFEKEEMQKALNKVETLKPQNTMADLMKLASSLQTQKPSYKERFMVKIGDKINSITADEILIFYSLAKSTFILTKEGKKYIVDYSLEYLETILNPKMFYRISRKYYVSIHACKNIISYTNSRLNIKIDALKDEEIIVSRERVSDFKNWLDS
ncbi:MAG: DNA-binding LytR/AlgR family response regulator [Planctomycetota bacterium]|jgi:DNA-binding LytR/AlgR family response regulator